MGALDIIGTQGRGIHMKDADRSEFVVKYCLIPLLWVGALATLLSLPCEIYQVLSAPAWVRVPAIAAVVTAAVLVVAGVGMGTWFLHHISWRE